MARITSHLVESKSKDHIRKIVNAFYDNGDSLYRDISERDYGIDAMIELFDNGFPTGEIGLLQIKGTQSAIVPLKTSNYVACDITTSNAYYAKQTNIPVILVYISIAEPIRLYYARIQDLIGDEQREKLSDQKTIRVKIPVENSTTDDLEPVFELIREYYCKE